MKQRLIVPLFLILVTTSCCFADEVVLKNGKILAGKILSQDEKLVVLRDTTGVKLQIRKSTIDSIKMERPKKPAVTRAPEQPVAESPTPAKEQPRKKARVYKKEDLEKMPELAIEGDEIVDEQELEDEEELKKELEELSQEEKELEAEWNEIALQLDDEIQAAREAYEDNKSFCDKVIPDLNDFPAGTYTQLTAEQYEEQRRYACMEAESAAKDLEKAQAEYEAFQEDARRKGIPPGWVDADRIRN